MAGALFAYYRGFVSVEAFSLFLSIQYVAMIIIGGMGSLLGAILGAVFVTLFPYGIEAGAARAARRPALCRHAVCRELRRLRRRHDPVPGAGAAGPRRHLAARADLLPAVAVQAPADGGAAPMSEPLLAVDKLEVVYQRAITAVQGITLSAHAGPDRRHPRHQRRRQDARCCAPSPASTASTMRASPRAPSASRAGASRTASRTGCAQAGIALVPEREKVFPNLTVAENLVVPAAPGLTAAERRRREEQVMQFFPKLGDLRHRTAGLLSGGERQMLAIAGALVCKPELLLVDELSLGLAPVVVDDLMARLLQIKRELGITILLVEQSAAVALEVADYSYVLENGRIVLDGDKARLHRPSRHPGVLSRPVERRQAPQLSRRQAVPPQPEVVWLSWRSRT